MTNNDANTSSPTEEMDKVDRYYTKASDYEIIPATGARGGIQYQGNFLIDFVVDMNETPEYETYEFTEDGLGDVTYTESDVRIYRESQVGVNLSQQTAFSVATWILANLLGPEVSEADIHEVLKQEYPEKLKENTEEVD